MPMTILVYDAAKFDAAAEKYVSDGSPILRAERQRDVDGARTFLASDAARKLYVEPTPKP
jgi:hypothetical protein